MTCGCSCGCCEGVEPLTPLPTANRPGLDALSYRVGTHATFLETMIARLSSHRLADGRRPLKRLTTRASDDPAIAMLDAWATVADVLTFYQERIANEGYLRTATERRSMVELARLTGYELRPGVAASVYLSFTLEKGYDVEVPSGTRARSLPGPGELPQAFETAEPIRAKAEWNAIAPRQTRPTILDPFVDFEGTRGFWLEGTSTDLTVNDVVVFVCPTMVQPFRVVAVEPDREAGRTFVEYAPPGSGFPPPTPPEPEPPPIITISATHENGGGQQPPPLGRLTEIVRALRRKPSLPPASRFQLPRAPERTYGAAGDLGPQLLVKFDPRLADTLYTAYANAPVTGVDSSALCRVAAMRVRAAPFGHNAPEELVFSDGVLVGRREWSLREFGAGFSTGTTATHATAVATDLQRRTISLDAVYEEIAVGGAVVIERADRVQPLVTVVEAVRTVSRADYGITGRVTQLLLRDPWLDGTETSLSVIRGTTVYARPESLELAEEFIADDVAGDTIELDGVYDGLDAGRWLVVSGIRTDVPGLAGDDPDGAVEASELVMLAGVTHQAHTIVDANGNETELPTDTLHTRLILSEPLAYTYRRDSVAINANVARATHGETNEEILGSGDASAALQAFALSGGPLTHVPAPTRSGVETTLEVRVDGVRWAEHDTLLYLGPADRGYVTMTDDDGETTVVFGDGKRGARLPTAAENVTATYRAGIGRAGNVDAGQISNLVTRPLGVKEVVNPQRATGGADPESRDQARRNIPLAVLSLDRLVSVRDYADFARTFAGIGKASAARLSDGRREVVHLTIAGADDIPIEESSDLYRNFILALDRYGDPNVALRVAIREAVFLLVSARVKVHADYRWNDVEPELRAALLDTFGFDRRDLGQAALLSDLIATVHDHPAVDYVDVDLFDGISETDALDPAVLAEKLDALAAAVGGGAGGPAAGGPVGCAARQPRQRIAVQAARVDPETTDPDLRIRPAQIAYLNPELPDTLVLTELTK